MDTSALKRTLMGRAARLFLLGMLTGIWVAVVFTQGRAIGIDLGFRPTHERMALAAHLNALLGTFWLLGLAFTLDYISFSPPGRWRLATLTTLAAYGNWAVTLLASILDVRGLEFGGSTANKVIAALLQICVVIPTLIAASAWAVGLTRKSPAKS